MQRAKIFLGLAVVLLGMLGNFGCASYTGARLYLRGTQELDRGEIVQAIATLETAATYAPEASEIQNHLGIAYREAGDHEKALHAFRRAVELDCTNRAAQHNLRLVEENSARPTLKKTPGASP